MNTLQRHCRFGWWSLLVFAAFGLTLEILHGFKVRAYLDVGNDTRRLMWTLAHAHGVLLSLVHVVVGLSAGMLSGAAIERQRLISRCLVGATIFMPGGFFLGGLLFYSGDPGLGIVLVPVGAVLLLIAVYLIARESTSVSEGTPPRSKAQHATELHDDRPRGRLRGTRQT